MTSYWNIDYEQDFIDQIIQYTTQEQSKIGDEIKKVAEFENPRDAGMWDDCGRPDEECPYIIQIYSGLGFIFQYEMDPPNNTLTYLYCEKLPINNHPQEETI